MHSTAELNSARFSVEVDGASAGVDALFPGFDEQDRLGVVVRRPCGGLGAATLILATVTAFYDRQRARAEEFFVYPDYFLFHVGERHGDHNWLEIWPGHKEVVVADEPEEILRAVNDRGVTRLLVEDGEPDAPELERESLASARGRIRSALAYGPDGRVADADVCVRGDATTERYVSVVLEQSGDVDAALRAGVAGRRRQLVEGGRPVESFRRLELEQALALLRPRASVGTAVAG